MNANRNSVRIFRPGASEENRFLGTTFGFAVPPLQRRCHYGDSAREFSRFAGFAPDDFSAQAVAVLSN